jgi:hypothetical protein
MRWGSVFMDLTVLPRRLKLRNEHGFARQPAATRLGNQVPGSEPPAISSSTEGCETRRCPLLASCGAASIVTSRRPTIESITRNQGLEQAIARSKSAYARATPFTMTANLTREFNIQVATDGTLTLGR